MFVMCVDAKSHFQNDPSIPYMVQVNDDFNLRNTATLWEVDHEQPVHYLTFEMVCSRCRGRLMTIVLSGMVVFMQPELVSTTVMKHQLKSSRSLFKGRKMGLKIIQHPHLAAALEWPMLSLM